MVEGSSSDQVIPETEQDMQAGTSPADDTVLTSTGEAEEDSSPKKDEEGGEGAAMTGNEEEEQAPNSSKKKESFMAAATSQALRPFVIISSSYLLFTVTDGAIRMIVLMHAYAKSFSALEVAIMFTPRASLLWRWPLCSPSTS